MFSDIDADIYVMVDGDQTYAAGSAWPMIEAFFRQATDGAGLVPRFPTAILTTGMIFHDSSVD